MSAEANRNIPQQINFTWKLEEDNGVTMFFIVEKQQQIKLFFSFVNFKRVISAIELRKMLNLLNESSDSKSVTRNWNIVNEQSNESYSVGNEVMYRTEVLKSNPCDCSNAYILVRGDIIVIGHNVTQVAFKNYATFI